MQHIDEEHKKVYVVTYKELIFIFVVFLSILFVLHPKDLIKEQILREKSNYDLSMLYLKNILEQEPDNEEVMLLLAQQSLASGNKDLSVKLLGLLLKSKDKEIRTRVTFLSYDLLKDDYHFLREEDDKRKIKEKLNELMAQIVKDNVYKNKDLEKWYAEAIFLNFNKAKYIFVKKLLKRDERNLTYLKDAYYLSVNLGYKADTTEYIHSLAQYDLKNQEAWQRDEYYTLIHHKQYEKAEILLQVYSESSLEWKKILAEFYIMRHSYLKATKVYEYLFNISDDYIEKKRYFIKMVQTLQAGNYLLKAAKLARSYESYYKYDRSVRNFLLKLYIATGYLDYAVTLSKQILEKEIKR